MLSGADTRWVTRWHETGRALWRGAHPEWWAGLKESWQVPQVPGIDARFKSSFRPATPVMTIGLELKRAWPRAMLARRLFMLSPSSCPSSLRFGAFAQASKRLKMTGVNGVACGFPPSGSLIPTKNAGVVLVPRMEGP